METRAAYAVVGAFVLALVAGLVVAVLWFAHGQFAEKNTRYDIYFASVSTGLVNGSPVQLSGVQVGRVIGVAIDPQNSSRVRVTIEVVASAPIRSDSVASIEVTSLTGGAVVAITPGSSDAPPIVISEGQRYPVIWSRESSLQQVVANVPQLIAKITDLADRMSSTLDDKNRAAIAATLDNLSRITATAAAHSSDLDQMFAEGAASAKGLRQTIDKISAAVDRFDQVAGQLGTTVRDIDGLVKDNRAPLKEFTENGLGELRDLVVQTNTLVGAMTRTVDSLERDPSRLIYGDRREGYRPQ